jgi:excisionase family DNA binding protein
MQDMAGQRAPVESWASVDDVMAHLGVARDTIYRWIEGKGMPAHRIGRLWKFKLSEIDVWVRSGGADENTPVSPHRGSSSDKATRPGNEKFRRIEGDSRNCLAIRACA